MSSKVNGNTDDWIRSPPPEGSFCEKLGKLIYNPEEKSFLGRTAKRWGIVLIFYGVFYVVLAVLFAVCMGGLFLTLEEKQPKYILADSLIGANPGVTSRPLYESTVLQIQVENSSHYEQYIQQLDEFFEPYKSERWWLNNKNCTSEDNYGFPDSPCIFVKVNRLIGWEPHCYDVSDLPKDMPEDLIEYIQSQAPITQKQVWVSCEEEKSNETTIEYPWGRGLPSVFYPYLNERTYRSPLVAVKLTPPTNRPVVIRCRAWAHNIIYRKSLKDPSGYTRVSLYIEHHTTSSVIQKSPSSLNRTRLRQHVTRTLPEADD